MSKLQDWQLMVVEEKNDLEAKINELHIQLNSYLFKQLSDLDQHLLTHQYFTMKQYRDILDTRIDKF